MLMHDHDQQLRDQPITLTQLTDLLVTAGFLKRKQPGRKVGVDGF